MAYQFHAWARKGISAEITTPDDLGFGTALADVRARIALDITVSGQSKTKQFTIAGPGDIIGIDQKMIVRTDPRPNSGDFEPNYFAAIEFYDEDFPWRYTPAAPTGENNSLLRPWLMLIVLTENEFEKTTRTTPLSSILVKDILALPPHKEMHLWAHVHSNFGDPDTPLEELIGSIRSKSETDPDGLFSRILCPRKLEHDVLYHAFLVPAFESGRLAGLGLANDETPAQQPSWTDSLVEIELPVYYRWQFRTGANADFETLLRMMEPRKELDPRVGIRDLVCTHPGYIKVDEEGEVSPPSPGILGMCGAVKQLSTVADELDTPVESQPFVAEIKKHLDLAVQVENTEQDPVVTIPFYGYHHGKTVQNPAPVFHPEAENWINQINRDPRNRTAAGLGTEVVQIHQEEFVQSAWAQLSKITEANRKIKQLKLAMEVNDRMLKGTFAKMGSDTGKILALARPVISKIKEIGASKTIFQTLTESQVPNAAVSSSFRRLSRPNGSISRKLNVTGSFSLGGVFNRLNPQFIPIFFVVTPSWFTTSSKIQISQNLPVTLPEIPSLKSNIQTANFRTRNVNLVSDDIKSVFNKNGQVSSIAIPKPVSTIKISLDYHSKVLDCLQPVKTLLPGFRAAIPGLPKPPETQEEILPVMAYPDFPEPAYEYLSAIDQDFILPNLDLVPPNTITLMEPNYQFIYSFLVGLNHEMGRELLWREYPTDQRGSYFRQFWDPGGRRSPEGTDQVVYPYKDIKPITEWGSNTALENFATIGGPFTNKPLVLLLKGELLKKYPNTVVFAQKAIKRNNKLILDDSNNIANLKFPLFSGSLAPDIRLLGFNLTVQQVRGNVQSTGFFPALDFGWFFVLAEVPGEPRFGMDITYAAPENNEKNTWDDLSLENFSPGSFFVSASEKPRLTSNGDWPNESSDTSNIDLEKWGRCSADMAGILLQKPAMMAIHGSELLKAF